MQFLPHIALAVATLGLCISVAASRKASTRFASSVLTRRISELEYELTTAMDSIEKLTALVKRQTARTNMQRAREKKRNENGAMDDDEWRRWATKQIQLGNKDIS